MSRTPKIKWILGICIVLGVLIFSVFCFFKDPHSSKYAIVHADKLAKDAYYVPLKVEVFTEGKVPCFNVEIENNKLLFRLDLGSDGYISILDEFLLKIKDKTFFNTKSTCGLKGNIYTNDVYDIPKMKLGPITFSPMRLSKEDAQFNEETLFNFKRDPSLPVIAGTIGWRIFNQTALLLDLGCSTIALCNSIETFKNQGYSVEKFTKVPMLDDRELIEFEIMTSKGPLRCVLDTGCTINFLNSNKVKGKTFSKIVRKEKNYKKISSVKINDREFGPIEFCKIPIKLPFHVDAILGMDFLTNHVVFIDFN
ncbi:MAG: hypothetical protein ABSA17_05175, partial [Rhabdochlamydiaceae bacterium]